MTDEHPLVEVVNLDDLDEDDARIADGLREEIVRDRATAAVLENYLRRRQEAD